MNDAGVLSAVFVAVFAAFYLMFIRPVHKDQARHREEIRNLRVGDEVLTTSNFIAKIREIQVMESGPARISLELADGVVVRATPAAILQRLEPRPADTTSTEQKGASA